MIRRSLAVPALCMLGIVAAAGCMPAMMTAADKTVGTVKQIIPSSNLKTHSVRSIKTVRVHRVAVMPFIDAPAGVGDAPPEGGAEAVTAEIYSEAAMAGGWEVVPQEDVDQAMRSLPPTTMANLDQNAIRLGREVSADAVLYGTIETYKERVGLGYAAASPASVAFTLKFADVRSKQVVWNAKFAKSQKALSQNFFDLINFVQHSGRWVRANEIALEGVREAVADLHARLDLTSGVKRFETGTYGQVKSGSHRYDRTGPGGIY